MNIKLKHCPFCGERAEIFVSSLTDLSVLTPIVDEPNLEQPHYTIRCCSCFNGTGSYKSLDRAIEAWNRRIKND